MISLTREFRFCLTDSGSSSGNDTATDPNRVGNSWTGWYTSNHVRPFLTFRLTVVGEIQTPTGYLCNVKLLDQLVQQFVQTANQLGLAEKQPLTYEQLIVSAAREIQQGIPAGASFERLDLVVSPTFYYSIVKKQDAMNSDNTKAKSKTNDIENCSENENAQYVRMTQQFEFSAAHRLHCAEYSDEQNREIFGKCNNPEGHGHNYVVEVTVGNQIQSPAGRVVCIASLEAAVKRLVIDRLDHKHLNRDVKEFAELNPSVENIAVKIWEWLNGNIADTQLERIRVYETPKTWAEYSG